MDKTTDLKIGVGARNAILRGVNQIYDAVKITLGPQGKNALLDRTYNRGPRVTNDGKTIAENIRPTNEHERLAADAFKIPIKRTDELAGDGTSTTTVIAGHLINKTFRDLSENDSPIVSRGKNVSTKGVMTIRNEIFEAGEKVVEEIKKVAKPIKSAKELEKIALVSTENPELATVISKMVYDLGVDNFIDVVEGFKGEIETEITKGMKFAAKVANKVFVNNVARFEMVTDDCHVLVTNHAIDNVIVFTRLLQSLKVNKLIVIAPTFSDDVLVMLVKSRQSGFFGFPVKAPSLRTEVLEDISLYAGAKFINKDIGKKLETINDFELGFCEKLVVKDTEAREDATMLGGRGEKEKKETSDFKERIETIKKQIIETKVELHKKFLERRIANLASAVGIIRVGAQTSDDALYMKLKAEDGVYACKAALAEGYVEGGGLCLKKIAEKLPENILTDSLKEPYEQIQRNCGGHLEISKDVIDPAKVVRLAVENAVSATATLITVDISVPEHREKSPAEGYEAIARAINRYATMFAKQHGLLNKASLDAEADMDRSYEEAVAQDK